MNNCKDFGLRPVLIQVSICPDRVILKQEAAIGLIKMDKKPKVLAVRIQSKLATLQREN